VRDHLLLWITSLSSGVTGCCDFKKTVYGWVECLSQVVAQPLLKYVFILLLYYFMNLFVVRELCVFENDFICFCVNY
jgi:hypothetical protein